MTKPTLQIIIGSTRPGRVGGRVAEWFRDRAVAHGDFAVEVLDLAEFGLPLFDEPHHPRLGHYVNQHTKDWSAAVSRGDAYVFVIPEYNHAINAATKNALDYLHSEWAHKPAGIVSYGGVSAGTRAAQMLKQVLAALQMVPLAEAVNIPFVQRLLDGDGNLVPSEVMEAGAITLLDGLAKWTEATTPLRDGRADKAA
ncbi:NADPH-dependent FMN reductase [Sphaerisporangium corydalis]|uniref:NADPH-dependent FMN reductase n=1 Tax=Sphaerisporangium corydalis TaxID=1441875 RepID=A0ABV9EIZ5_9ACTN|nr:NAD(P)H-dependent oxidoreductase [Sphaerisporangium corydalis]